MKCPCFSLHQMELLKYGHSMCAQLKSILNSEYNSIDIIKLNKF